MAQINFTVGDLEGNVEKIRHYIRKAKRKEADLVAFPELAIDGYPPQDLLYENGFVQENRASLEKIVQESEDIATVHTRSDRMKPDGLAEERLFDSGNGADLFNGSI